MAVSDVERFLVALALTLAFSGNAAFAETLTVKVGGYTTTGSYYGGGTNVPTYKFDPPAITINVGDSITFKNVGGAVTEAHNAHADDDSFRCANGCRGDGSGATGDPASNQWSSTVKFTKAGVINYSCDSHKSMGMTGTITVNAVAGTQSIVNGLSGNWDDPTPNQGGHGVQIEILPNHDILAIWFVFNPGGTAQNWIYAQGGFDPASSEVTVPAYLESGGAFPPNFDRSKLTVKPWGSLQLTFTDCSHGKVDWIGNDDSRAAGYDDTSFPIQQLTRIDGTVCP